MPLQLIVTGPEPRCAIVMLHGSRMDPLRLRAFVDSIGIPAVFCLPAGPVAEGEGEGQHSWWPVEPAGRAARLAAGGGDLAHQYPAGRELARAALDTLMHELHRRHPALPIVVVGFSQGGMLAVDDLLLGAPPPIAGLALLSTTRIAFDEWQPRLGRVAGLPVLVAHGRSDADIALEAGERLRDALAQAGARVTWLPFNGGHEIPLPVWRGLKKYLSLFTPNRREGPAATAHAEQSGA